MGWRLRLDVDDDLTPPRRSKVLAVVVVTSLWILGLTVLAVWLAALVVR